MWLIQIRALRKKLQLTLRRKGVRKRRVGGGEAGDRSGGRERGRRLRAGCLALPLEKGVSDPPVLVTAPEIPEFRKSP